ncbi:hypothetical protein TRAPUB_3603 [Trametes pubescens]|uniref:Uncharacterized protein n=1 Tax=Trametes pubescens TaxID=154538 RepID=A0A1M2VD74_TRAPU|nr:hypothetical protein TRAPUB_3603 [Trametes pubescens]
MLSPHINAPRKTGMPGPLTRNICDSENVPKILDGDKVIWGVSRLGTYDLVSKSLSWGGDPCVSSLNKLSTAQRWEFYRTYPQLFWVLFAPQVSLTMLPLGLLPEDARSAPPAAPPSSSIPPTRAADRSASESETPTRVGAGDPAESTRAEPKRPVYKALGTHKFPAELYQQAQQRVARTPPASAVPGLAAARRTEVDLSKTRAVQVVDTTGGKPVTGRDVAPAASNPTRLHETGTRHLLAEAVVVQGGALTRLLYRPVCMMAPNTVDPWRDLRVQMEWKAPGKKVVRRPDGTSISVPLAWAYATEQRLAGCIQERVVPATGTPAEYNTTWSINWDSPWYFGVGACTSPSLEFNFQTDEELEGTGTRAPLACMLWTFLDPRPCKVIMVFKKRQGSSTDKMLTSEEKQMLGIGMSSRKVKEHHASRGEGAA